MLCKCHWIVLYTVHFTAFCLGGGAFFPGHGVCSFCICNYTESKNWATFTFTVTLANVGRFFFNSFNVGIRKKWLITRMQNFPPQLNFVATVHYLVKLTQVWMWTFTRMLFYSAMQNSSKTWQGWQKVDKIKTINKFKVSALRTNTSSKSFAPLINRHVDSRRFKAAPNFNQPLLQFVDGVDFPLVYTTLHDSPDLVINWSWDLDCLEATNLEKWSMVVLDAKPPVSRARCAGAANSHTGVSFTR